MTENGNLRLPWPMITSAVVVALVGLSAWCLTLERDKADRSQVQEIKLEINERLSRIEGLLITHMNQVRP